jgi:hypothetical protein
MLASSARTAAPQSTWAPSDEARSPGRAVTHDTSIPATSRPWYPFPYLPARTFATTAMGTARNTSQGAKSSSTTARANATAIQPTSRADITTPHLEPAAENRPVECARPR